MFIATETESIQTSELYILVVLDSNRMIKYKQNLFFVFISLYRPIMKLEAIAG